MPRTWRDGLDADLEKIVRIEEYELGVAVLQIDAQLVRGGAVDVLRAQVLDPVSPLAPVNERAVDVGIACTLTGIVGRVLLRVAPSLERLQGPGIPAVPRLDRRQALERHFRPDHPGALLDLAEFRVVEPEAQLSRQSHRPDRSDFRFAAPCFQILRDELVRGEGASRGGGPRRRGRKAEHGDDRGSGREHAHG